MDRKDGRYTAVAGCDLLQSQRVADMVGACPAPLRRHQRAHKAELAEFGQRLFGEPRFAIPFRSMRCEQVLGDITRGISQQDLLFGKPHSITSSACASSRGGTVRPSVFAILTLIARSNL